MITKVSDKLLNEIIKNTSTPGVAYYSNHEINLIATELRHFRRKARLKRFIESGELKKQLRAQRKHK